MDMQWSGSTSRFDSKSSSTYVIVALVGGTGEEYSRQTACLGCIDCKAVMHTWFVT